MARRDISSVVFYAPQGSLNDIDRHKVKGWSPNTTPGGKIYPGRKEVRYPKKHEVSKKSPEPENYTEDN
jgi:hypothetical protein